MSDIEYGLEGAKLAFSFLLLWYAFRTLRGAILANWRQDLFRLRNGLWDTMRAEGCLDSEAHRRLRNDINGVIRIGPSLNLVSFVISVSMLRQAKNETPANPIPLESLPTEKAKQAAMTAEHQLVALVLKRMFFHSFPGYLIGWPLWVVYRSLRYARFAQTCTDNLVRKVTRRVRRWAVEVEPVAEAVERDRVLVMS